MPLLPSNFFRPLSLPSSALSFIPSDGGANSLGYSTRIEPCNQSWVGRVASRGPAWPTDSHPNPGKRFGPGFCFPFAHSDRQHTRSDAPYLPMAKVIGRGAGEEITGHGRRILLLIAIALFFGVTCARAAVVINEIMYHPPHDREGLQYIELWNASS